MKKIVIAAAILAAAMFASGMSTLGHAEKVISVRSTNIEAQIEAASK